MKTTVCDGFIVRLARPLQDTPLHLDTHSRTAGGGGRRALGRRSVASGAARAGQRRDGRRVLTQRTDGTGARTAEIPRRAH